MHPGRGKTRRFAKSNRRLHLTLRQSRAGVASPSSWRREEALDAYAWECALPELQRQLFPPRCEPGCPPRTRPAGRARSGSRRRR